MQEDTNIHLLFVQYISWSNEIAHPLKKQRDILINSRPLPREINGGEGQARGILHVSLACITILSGCIIYLQFIPSMHEKRFSPMSVNLLGQISHTNIHYSIESMVRLDPK